MQCRLSFSGLLVLEISNGPSPLSGIYSLHRPAPASSMRVCLLKYGFYENAASLMQFATSLADRGDSVEVIALGRIGQAQSEWIGGVRVRRVSTRTVNERHRLTYLLRVLMFFFRSMLLLTVRHIKRPYHVIHVQSVPDFLVFAAAFAKLLGARVILDAHEAVPEFYASKFHEGRHSLGFRALLWMEKLTATFADHILIPNPLWYKRFVARSSRPEKCSFMRYLPDPRIFYPRSRQRLDPRFLMIYPGTLNVHQGLDVAIRAFARLSECFPAAEFHIYGEGPAKAQLLRLTKSLGLNLRVHFYDMVPKNRLPDLLSAYDLAIVPKRASCSFGNEAESTKILELMAVGVPVVVARTRIDSLYHSEKTVQFFESGDDASLADCILRLANNPALRQRLVANGCDYFLNNNWDTVKPIYLTIVDSLSSPRTATVEAPMKITA
jgi:glycosyltransferase involved in cell wall biosynthesis